MYNGCMCCRLIHTLPYIPETGKPKFLGSGVGVMGRQVHYPVLVQTDHTQVVLRSLILLLPETRRNQDHASEFLPQQLAQLFQMLGERTLRGKTSRGYRIGCRLNGNDIVHSVLQVKTDQLVERICERLLAF